MIHTNVNPNGSSWHMNVELKKVEKNKTDTI